MTTPHAPDLTRSLPMSLGEVRRYLARTIGALGQTYDPATGIITDASGGTIDISQLSPAEQIAALQFYGFTDQEIQSYGLGTPMTVDLPDGSSAVVLSINTTGDILTVDGWQSMTLPDGTGQWVNVHTGDVMHADGTITAAATPTTDGSTTGDSIIKWVNQGLSWTEAVRRVLGLPTTPATGGRWVGSQYRLANGSIVTPIRQVNGSYVLPDGTVVPGPSSRFGGMGLGVLAAAGAGAFLLLKRKG